MLRTWRGQGYCINETAVFACCAAGACGLGRAARYLFKVLVACVLYDVLVCL